MGRDVRAESGYGKRKRTVRKSLEPASNGEAAARNKRGRTDVARESNAIKRLRCLAGSESRGEDIWERWENRESKREREATRLEINRSGL